MTRIGLCLSIAVGLLATGYGFAPSMRTLRVLTYNIHHGEGTDGVIDLVRQAEVVKSLRPDFVALQEVDQATERSKGVNQLDELERLTGMQGAFGKAMDYSGGAYGVAVLSAWPIVRTRIDPLRTFSGREPRAALTAIIRVDESRPAVQVTIMHLDPWEEANRLAQAAQVNALPVEENAQAILAGDMNSRPDTDVFKLFGTQWVDATTAGQSLLPMPDGRPRFRGDYVLVRQSACLRGIESNVVDDRIASDHRPVLVVLEWLESCQHQ